MNNINVTGPVGMVVADSGIETFIKVMAAKWEENRKTSKWWQLWGKVNFVPVTNFLLGCLDDLIAYVDGTIEKNIDKKATVLNAINRLYDTVVIPVIPMWLKPFAPLIRKIIVDEVLSAAIDWIVSKYRNGAWNKKNPEELVAQWCFLEAQIFGVPGDHRPK